MVLAAQIIAFAMQVSVHMINKHTAATDFEPQLSMSLTAFTATYAL